VCDMQAKVKDSKIRLRRDVPHCEEAKTMIVRSKRKSPARPDAKRSV
jgi:hypothetical protein